MSIELYVLVPDATAPTIQAWQNTIEAAAFPLILHAEGDLASNCGFIPATYDGRRAGFEFYLDDAFEIIATYPDVGHRAGQRTKCGTFRWGGDLLEMCAALSAAASLAKLTSGLYFDPQDNILHEADEALVATREALKSVTF